MNIFIVLIQQEVGQWLGARATAKMYMLPTCSGDHFFCNLIRCQTLLHGVHMRVWTLGGGQYRQQ